MSTMCGEEPLVTKASLAGLQSSTAMNGQPRGPLPITAETKHRPAHGQYNGGNVEPLIKQPIPTAPNFPATNSPRAGGVVPDTRTDCQANRKGIVFLHRNTKKQRTCRHATHATSGFWDRVPWIGEGVAAESLNMTEEVDKNCWQGAGVKRLAGDRNSM